MRRPTLHTYFAWQRVQKALSGLNFLKPLGFSEVWRARKALINRPNGAGPVRQLLAHTEENGAGL
jgi:hypothetical protein